MASAATFDEGKSMSSRRSEMRYVPPTLMFCSSLSTANAWSLTAVLSVSPPYRMATAAVMSFVMEAIGHCFSTPRRRYLSPLWRSETNAIRAPTKGGDSFPILRNIDVSLCSSSVVSADSENGTDWASSEVLRGAAGGGNRMGASSSALTVSPSEIARSRFPSAFDGFSRIKIGGDGRTGCCGFPASSYVTRRGFSATVPPVVSEVEPRFANATTAIIAPKNKNLWKVSDIFTSSIKCHASSFWLIMLLFTLGNHFLDFFVRNVFRPEDIAFVVVERNEMGIGVLDHSTESCDRKTFRVFRPEPPLIIFSLQFSRLR